MICFFCAMKRRYLRNELFDLRQGKTALRIRQQARARA